MVHQSPNRDMTGVSKATIARMPAYLRYLKEESVKGTEYVASAAIAKDMAVSAVLVRKDLALVSSVAGRPRLGFEVNQLIEDIESFLGYDNVSDALVVGVGGLGKAFLSHEGFKNYGLNIVAGFDVNPALIHTTINQKPIFHLSELEYFVRQRNINIGIITVPKKVAQEVCNTMVKAGLKAIWNFAPVKLTVPKGVIVRYEDLAASLAMLSGELFNMLEGATENQ
jgi:redox-sensing transcriptional repressor